MYNNYKIKTLVFSGRERYLKILLPQLQVNELVDEIMIGVNTLNELDIKYIESLPNKFSKVKLYYVDKELISHKIPSLKFLQLFTYTCDIDTIYFKIDDDILFIEKDTIQKMIEFKCTYPKSGFIYPFIVNNPFFNCLIDNHEITSAYMKYTHGVPEYSLKLHRRFLNNELTNLRKQTNAIELPSKCMFDQNVSPSINFICYFGFDMLNAVSFNHSLQFFKAYGDEHAITQAYPLKCTTRKNYAIMNTHVVHWSFNTQSKYLLNYEDELLPRYKERAIQEYGNIYESV